MDSTTWTAEDVGRWLVEIGLGQYSTNFVEERITGDFLLLHCNDEAILTDLGITSTLHRRRIAFELAKLSEKSNQHATIVETTSAVASSAATNRRKRKAATLENLKSTDREQSNVMNTEYGDVVETTSAAEFSIMTTNKRSARTRTTGEYQVEAEVSEEILSEAVVNPDPIDTSVALNLELSKNNRILHSRRPENWEHIAKVFEECGFAHTFRAFVNELAAYKGNPRACTTALQRWSKDLKMNKRIILQRPPVYGADLDHKLIIEVKSRRGMGVPIDGRLARELLEDLLRRNDPPIHTLMVEHGGKFSFGAPWYQRFCARHKIPTRVNDTVSSKASKKRKSKLEIATVVESTPVPEANPDFPVQDDTPCLSTEEVAHTDHALLEGAATTQQDVPMPSSSSFASNSI